MITLRSKKSEVNGSLDSFEVDSDGSVVYQGEKFLPSKTEDNVYESESYHDATEPTGFRENEATTTPTEVEETEN